MWGRVVRIHWHDKQPIFSADFDPTDCSRVATAGGDNNVRIWRLRTETNDDGSPHTTPVYCATLSRHVKSVNCVRFSHSGEYLASAGDGGSTILWRQTPHPIGQSRRIFGSASDDEISDDGSLEYWTAVHTFRASDVEDIYDLCWSPDDDHLLLGLTDNTAQVWDVLAGKCVRVLRDHQHFVQGVAWDPLGSLLVTQSADRSAKIWHAQRKATSGALQFTAVGKLNKLAEHDGPAAGSRPLHFFHDETLVSFFRRAAFSPDGALLFLPAGMFSASEGLQENCLYIMGRGQVSTGTPAACIAGFEKAVLGIRCNPRLFKTIDGPEEPLFRLPYRIIYAAFTMDALLIFDTRQSHPLAVFGDLHYGSLTDVAWSPDGYSLLLTSTDGFCSLVHLLPEEMGETCRLEEQATMVEDLRTRYGLARRSMHPPPSTAVPLEQSGNEQRPEASSLLPSSDPITEVAPPEPAERPPAEEASPSVEINELPASFIRRRIQPTLIQ